MQISDLLNIIRRYWWPIVLLPLAAVAITYAVRSERTYAATDSLQILPAGPVTNISSQGVQYLIPPVVARIETRQFAAEAASMVDPSDAKVPVNIKVNGDTATGLLTIKASGSNANAVASWANAYGSYLVAHPGSVAGLASISVIENAVQPGTPQSSGTKAELIGAGLLGLILGLLTSLGIGFLRSQRSDPEFIKSRYGTQILAVLPTSRRRPNSAWMGSVLAATPAIRELNMRLALAQADRSATKSPIRPAHAVAVLSDSRRQGRTEVANALAWEMSQSGLRVAVVYADINGARSDRSAIRQGNRSTPESSGNGRQPTPYFLDEDRHPSEALLSSLPALLKELLSRYDMVIIDAPPAGEGADAEVVALLAGAAIWVTRRRTDRNLLRRNVARFTGHGVDVLGLVFNRPPRLVLKLHRRSGRIRGRRSPGFGGEQAWGGTGEDGAAGPQTVDEPQQSRSQGAKRARNGSAAHRDPDTVPARTGPEFTSPAEDPDSH